MAQKATYRIDGRILTDADLEQLKAELESFDEIAAVHPDIREIVAAEWPHLLAKLDPPKRN